MTNLLEPRFCYRIIGNETPQYTQTFFEGGKFLEKEIYASVHRNVKWTLSNELGIPPQFLICISQEEYDVHRKGIRND